MQTPPGAGSPALDCSTTSELPEILYQASLNRVANVIASLKDAKADKDQVVSTAEFKELKTTLQRIEHEFIRLSSRVSGLENAYEEGASVEDTAQQEPPYQTAWNACESTSFLTAPPVQTPPTSASATMGSQPNCTNSRLAGGLLSGVVPLPRQDGMTQGARTGGNAILTPPSSLTSSSMAERSYLKRLEKKLRKRSIQLTGLLQPEISASLTKGDVQNLHKSLLPEICRDMEQLDKLTDTYLKEAGEDANEPLIDVAERAFSSACIWREALLVKYRELDCGVKSLNPAFFGDLDKFTEDSDMTIYYHISKFEKMVGDQGSKMDRAYLLYSRYLHESIQRRCIEHKDDYDMLRGFLLKKFGEPHTMCIKIADSIPNAPPDDSIISKSLVDHYKILEAALKKIDELFNLPNISQEDLSNYAFSHYYIGRLFGFMPYKARDELLTLLSVRGLNIYNLQGKHVYLMIKQVILKFSSITESHLLLRPEVETDLNSSGKPHDEPELDYFTPNRMKDLTSSAVGDDTADSIIKTCHHKFPCPIENHDHEVGTCEDFMTARPETRRLMTTGKLCWSCLGPFKKCKRVCQTNVPSGLICSQCSDYGKSKGFGPLNYLMCHKDAHKVNINPHEYTSALEAYLPGFTAREYDAKKIIGILLTCVSGQRDCKRKMGRPQSPKKRSRTRKPDPFQKVQCVNSEQGRLEKVKDSRIIKETVEDAFYVTQVINVLGKDVLTLFDSGANHNLIRGNLGEDLGMKVVTDAPVSIRTAGGGKVQTDFGSYKVCLGPTDDNKYQEVTAQGITTVTERFNKYSLLEVNKEVRDIKKLPPGTILPKYTGGMDAGLLIGMQTSGIFPRLLFRLPSGLGVYESPIKDKFGSRICYGGPHPVFTRGNKVAGLRTDPPTTCIKSAIM